MNGQSAFLPVFGKKLIETFPCPLCNAPNRVVHDNGLLLIPGRCAKCGKEVEFDNSKVLNTLVSVWERGKKRD